MQSAKDKVKILVAQYIQLFPNEYQSFLESTRMKRDNITNEFAEFKRSDQLARHLVDIPETLHNMFRMRLEQDEWDWLYALNDYEKNHRGMGWFIRTFPQFKITSDF